MNGNIDWHCMSLKLHSNAWIEIKYLKSNLKGVQISLNPIKIWSNPNSIGSNFQKMGCKLMHKWLKRSSSLSSFMTMMLKKKKNNFEKTSFHFIKIQTEIYFSKMKWLVNRNLVYHILGLMWTVNLSTLYQLQCEL